MYVPAVDVGVAPAGARCFSSVSAAEAAVAADGAVADEMRYCSSDEAENIRPAAAVAAVSAAEDAAAARPSDDAGPEAGLGYEDSQDGAGSGFEDS